jgi:hypothetical protein
MSAALTLIRLRPRKEEVISTVVEADPLFDLMYIPVTKHMIHSVAKCIYDCISLIILKSFQGTEM